jgi:hypothetical protein
VSERLHTQLCGTQEDTNPNAGSNRLTASELGHIGVNLNQQIRAMNTAISSGQDIPTLKSH